MDLKDIPAQQVVSAWLLILSFPIFAVGGILYTGRAIWKWPAAGSPAFLAWERSFVMAALLTAVLGLIQLEKILEAAGDNILALSGLALFLAGSAAVIFAETYYISRQEWLYAPIVVFVVLAFLGQALIGLSVLQTGLLPGWVGWAAVVWSLGWLVVLPIARPHDIYYPWLHYIPPLLYGIALLSAR